MLLKKIGPALLLVISLAGCDHERYRDVIDQRSNETQRGIQEAQQPAEPKPYDPLVVTDKVWMGNSAVRLHRGSPLPSRFEVPRGVALVSTNPMKLSEVASVITSQTGIPVRVAQGIEDSSSKSSRAKNKNADSDDSGMTLAYEGPLSGLLDQVSGYFGISWKYDGASINFSRYDTRVFVLETMPGTQTVKDGMKEDSSSSGGSSSSGSGSSSNDLQQSAEMSAEFKVWEEIDKTIGSIIGNTGNVVIAPSSGTITVTTTPELMRTVARFIEEENKRLTRQVAINVEIYSVSLSDASDFSMSFDTVLERIKDIGATYASPSSPSAVTGGGTLSVAILNGTSNEVIFNALQSVGNTTRVAQFPLTTLNNRPVTRRVGRDRAYVESVQNSQSTSFQSSTITPGTIREGFSLQVTPRVLDDGRIMLQYSFSLIDIVKIETFTNASGTTSESSVQLPETATRVFVQQSLLKSGSTLVIGGYDEEQTTQDSQGALSPFNYLLGGGYNDANSRSMMFIAITPQVLDVPRMERDL